MIQVGAFPIDYPDAIRQAQSAVKAALSDGHELLEVEFPAAGLSSGSGIARQDKAISSTFFKRSIVLQRSLLRQTFQPSSRDLAVIGDGEGGAIMTYSLGYLRQFCRLLHEQASSTRIYFPDEKVASFLANAPSRLRSSVQRQRLASGLRCISDRLVPAVQEMLLAAGRSGVDDGEAVFGTTAFQLDYLTRPSFLHDIGLGALDKVNVAKGVKDSDKFFVVAYPYFNVGGRSN